MYVVTDTTARVWPRCRHYNELCSIKRSKENNEYVVGKNIDVGGINKINKKLTTFKSKQMKRVRMNSKTIWFYLILAFICLVL